MTGFLPAPRRRRAYFMLTPLVDVMFLLLIFFMLSSETGLYTLLRLSAPTVAGEGSAPAVAQAGTAELLISIGRGVMRVNGAATPLAELGSVLADYKGQGIARAALVPTGDSQAQDVVAVLELFEAAAFDEVRLVAMPAVVP